MMAKRALPLIVLVTLLAAASTALAFLQSAAGGYNLAIDRPEIGGAIYLEVDLFVSTCNQVGNLRVEEVSDRLVDTGLGLGLEQQLVVEIYDDGPLEPIFCDQVKDTRVSLPIGVLRSSRVIASVTVIDQVNNINSSPITRTALPELLLQLARPLQSQLLPAQPTVLDDLQLLAHTRGGCVVINDSLLPRLQIDVTHHQDCNKPLSLTLTSLGQFPQGTRIDVENSLNSEEIDDLIDPDVLAQPVEVNDLVSTFPATLGEVEYRVPTEASGIWFSPDNAGSGLSLHVLEGGRVVAYWTTIDPAGLPVWIYGEGQTLPPDDNPLQVLVNFDAFILEQSMPGPLPRTDTPTLQSWGTFELKFSACDKALHVWQPSLPGWQDGEAQTVQLAGNAAANCVSRRQIPVPLN